MLNNFFQIYYCERNKTNYAGKTKRNRGRKDKVVIILSGSEGRLDHAQKPAKYHNFTKAAQALNNSQPNITRAMNCLEQQLNTTLFIRTNRGVQLTPEGERLYTHVLGAMEQFQAAEEELADSSGLSHGSVAIGASETALNIFLLDKLKNFHMTYPGIRLKLYNHSTPEAIESVKSGKIDFAVVSTPAEVDSALKQIMLMPFQEILVGGTTFTALGS